MRVAAGAAAPRYARPFVVAFTVLLVVCAAGPFNLWPFSSWQLFSRLRSHQQTAWDAVAFDSAGRQRDDPTAGLTYDQHGFASTVTTLSGRSPSARTAICDAWLNDTNERFGTSTRLLRIYRLKWLLSDPRHRPPSRRILVLSCSEESVQGL